MNVFDEKILLFLNGFVGRWPHFDAFVGELQRDNLLKGAVFLAPIWYLWFRPAQTEQQTLQSRQRLFATICAMTIAIVLARLLADLLPFRERPAVNAELHLVPIDGRSFKLASWSSFPSDHAVVWFTLAFGVLQLHRSLGVAACLYACLLSGGRIYTEIHYPTDIIAAAAIAAGVTWLLCRRPVRIALYAPVGWLQQRHPAAFYAGAFLVSYEIANLFDEARALGELAWRAVRVAA